MSASNCKLTAKELWSMLLVAHISELRLTIFYTITAQMELSLISQTFDRIRSRLGTEPNAMPKKQASLLDEVIAPTPVAPPPPKSKGVNTIMDKSIEELLKQRAEIDAEIEKARTQARSTAFSEIERILGTSGITIQELSQHFSKKGGATTDKKRTVAAAKYVDPADPKNTWSGRGKPSRWLQAYLNQGQKLEEFLIKA